MSACQSGACVTQSQIHHNSGCRQWLPCKPYVAAWQRRKQRIKTAYEKLETDLGFHYSEDGLLSSRYHASAGVGNVLYDWMHVFFVSGVCNHVIGSMFHALRASQFAYASAYAYLKEWHGDVENAVDTFAPSQASKWLEAKLYKASASQLRSILPVLGHYVRQGLSRSDSPVHRDHAACFLHLCNVIEEIEASQRRTSDAATLRRELTLFMQLYQR